MDQINEIGRRKTAVARVFLSEGTGKITVNGKDITQYFTVAHLYNSILQPFKITATEGKYDVKANIRGGGVKGQSEALRLGISRALVDENEEFRKPLKDQFMLTRDARAVERKKPGLRKARRRTQFSKR
ncbi:30S ribosomal protein S9 [Sphingobacteriales bacterium UPWRP_1]|nr:30S ribosomal protein S9 [Sphingobacteriales bacterium TSM_CSS]PSJ76953.1 30S ribosomal protein S9 [Sphingobacteriales bacterium UPWRP_1]